MPYIQVGSLSNEDAIKQLEKMKKTFSQVYVLIGCSIVPLLIWMFIGYGKIMQIVLLLLFLVISFSVHGVRNDSARFNGVNNYQKDKCDSQVMGEIIAHGYKAAFFDTVCYLIIALLIYYVCRT